MSGSQICTAQQAVNHQFIIRELIKQVIGLVLFLLYARLVYVLMKRQQFSSNVFYKLVILNGCAVGFLMCL